jgi:predicted acylesterase/phospholipase RssA
MEQSGESPEGVVIPAVDAEHLERARIHKVMDDGSRRLLEAEASYIRRWRGKWAEQGTDAREVPGQADTGTGDLVGLALSGGGIRSATFSLGVMQALAARGLLKGVDYLSTVSGGGYIGSALTWLLSARAKEGYETDPDCKNPAPKFGVSKTDFPFGTQDPEPGAPRDDNESQRKLLRYLREHGYYLTPGAGITAFSLLGVVLRGTFLNLLVWLPAAILFFVFGLWAAAKIGPALPFDLEHSPVLAYTLGELRPASECEPPIPAATATTPPTDEAVCNTLITQQEFDMVLARLPELAGFELFLWIFGLLVAALMLGTVVYSLVTFFRPFFPRRLEPAWYGWRRRSEKLAAIILPILLVTLIVGTLPLVVVHLQSWLEMAGPLAIVVGIGTLMRYFLASGRGDGSVPSSVVVPAAAALFLYGFLLVAYLLAFRYFPGPGHEAYPWTILGLLCATLGTGLVVNLNHISIHRFYRDRLMEAFMPDLCFALRNRTGVAAKCADAARLHEVSPPEDPHGPYHIINTNVVLVNSDQRSYKERGGDNFILSPLYCGSNATGWSPTKDFMKGIMTLPTAVAISGAAANPNTGVGGVGLTRNLFLSMVMSLLNLRLGYWAINPNPDKRLLPHTPNHFRPGAYAFGNAMRWPGLGYEENRTFVELSDGGHFENTGVYELVRRRAKLIIVCDGGADKEFSFSDFQTTVRRMEDDFGARVKVIDPDSPDLVVPIPKEGYVYPREAKFAAQGHMLGAITYADDSEGTIIYLKTALIPEVSFKVKAYAAQNTDFPDQSTADQFFDEAQFESYRELGYRIATTMLGCPAPGKHKPGRQPGEEGAPLPYEDTLEAFIRNRGVA